MDVAIPANTKATIYLPAANADQINESGNTLTGQKGIEIKNTTEGYVEVNVGSGKYHFTIQQ